MFSRRSPLPRVALALGALAPALACHRETPPEPIPPQTEPLAAADAQGAAPLAASDAGIDDAAVDIPHVDVGALFMHTPVMSAMEFPAHREEDRKKQEERGIMRIGYLRRGAKVAALPEPHVKPNCPEGWYELLSGGFVCGKHVTVDLNHPKLKTAAHPPDLSGAPLPYEYAYNVGQGTPLYRTLPSKQDRPRFEPWLMGNGRKKKLEDNPYGDYAQTDAGLWGPAAGSPTDPLALGYEADGGLPWYLREWDGGKPPVTLDDLRGEGPIVRRMVRGFYIAIDDEIEVDKVKWWRSTYGYVAPYERMTKVKLLTDFHGVWLNQESPPAFPPPSAQPDGGVPAYYVDDPPTHLPMAIMKMRGRKYAMSPDKKKATPMGEQALVRFTPVQLTGEHVTLGGLVFWEAAGGYWVRQTEAVVMEPPAPPSDLKPGEKWIAVNLTTQSLVAFEGDKAVYATLISSGKKDKIDKERNHETRPGSFRIREKHIAETMDADTATDGPYSIEDVPWIQYFNGSIALHGAFWHSSFGYQRSHGCVNLAPLDARALFFWSDPQLPPGWHSVWATPSKPGTRVIVHGESLPK
jgi:lipoprotein-anchoring transpeptidase ErfK/SrfK